MDKIKNLSKFFDTAAGHRFYYLDTSAVNGSLVKRVRNYYKMTQLVFASILGISIKLLDKWENDKKKVDETSARLIALLNEHPELMNDLYYVEEIN